LVPAPHAAVIVAVREDGKVLGVTRGENIHDINLPGGMREPEDGNILDTARREFFEETGLVAGNMKPVLSWRQNGKLLVAFQAMNWKGRLRPSAEGYPVWVPRDRLFRPSCTHREANRRLVLHPALH
jgi:8-oxo-dGTP pyrophosphatase MutT (NUDIX family)